MESGTQTLAITKSDDEDDDSFSSATSSSFHFILFEATK